MTRFYLAALLAIGVGNLVAKDHPVTVTVKNHPKVHLDFGVAYDHHGDNPSEDGFVELLNGNPDTITWTCQGCRIYISFDTASPCMALVASNSNRVVTCTLATDSPGGGTVCANGGSPRRCFKYSIAIISDATGMSFTDDPEVILDNEVVEDSKKGRPQQAGQRPSRKK